MSRTADVVICGAGITGVAAAHFLSKSGIKNILLIVHRIHFKTDEVFARRGVSLVCHSL